ncbi:MAG: hypothetical protein WC176_06730 [Candidatus Cloacimonadaceae bacterium]|nr:hypothetical protein [Candidatus Cloacimonadota bacterium]
MQISKKGSNIIENKSYLRFTTIKAKPIVSVFFILAIIVLIIGMIYPVVRIKSDITDGLDIKYSTAQDVYKREKSVVFINEQFIEQEMLKAIQDYSSIGSLLDFNGRLNSQVQGKLLCVKSSGDLTMSNTLESRFDAVADQIRQAYESDMSYELRQAYENLQQLRNLAYYMRITTNYYINNARFGFVMGRASSISVNRNEIVFEGEFFPVTDQGFLDKLSITLSVEDKIRFEQDVSTFNSIINEELEILRQSKDAYMARVKNSRSALRKYFYAKWYGILVSLLLSFFMLRFLLMYFSLIQRKGLPKKSTHKVYFAINTTAIIFRWLALLTIVLGIISLGINVLQLIFSSSSGGRIPIIGFFAGSFLSQALSPIFITVATVIATWLNVLIAEHLCLISSLCHISFLKTYGEDILEPVQLDQEPEEQDLQDQLDQESEEQDLQD